MAEKLTVRDLLTDKFNANLGSPAGAAALDQSIASFGIVRPVAMDRNGVIIAGNQTHAAALRAGNVEVIVVKTTGNTLIVNQREDMDFNSDDPEVRAKTRGASLADNRVAQLSQNIDPVIVQEQLLTCQIIPSTCGYAETQLVPAAPSFGPTGEVAETTAEPDERREPEPLGEPKYVQRMRQVVIPCADEEEQQKWYECVIDLGGKPELRTL
jgi:hypothetical protein